MAWEELHAVKEPHLVGLLLHRALSFLFWLFLLSGLYLCILWDLFPYFFDDHSDYSFLIQITVLTLLRFFNERVETILDHVFIFCVIKDA